MGLTSNNGWGEQPRCPTCGKRAVIKRDTVRRERNLRTGEEDWLVVFPEQIEYVCEDGHTFE